MKGISPIPSSIIYRQIHPSETGAVSSLAREVFDQFVAPHYQTEGVAEFHRYASADALSQRHKSGHVTLVAEHSGEFVGMLHLREPRHVSMLFVQPSLQRRELLAGPIEMLLRSCPERRYLLLVISVTGVISVGVDNLEPVLHQAKELVERFHQRLMLLLARLAFGVSAAFLLKLFDGWLNFRALLFDQNAKRKRAHITDPAQQRRSHDHHRHFRLRIHG